MIGVEGYLSNGYVGNSDLSMAAGNSIRLGELTGKQFTKCYYP